MTQPPPSEAEVDALQNALVRLGGSHFVELQGFVPAPEEPQAVIYAVLAEHPYSRFVTSLGPILVRHLDQMDVPQLWERFEEAHLAGRLGWLLEMVAEAVEGFVQELTLPEWRPYLRAAERLHDFLALHSPTAASGDLEDLTQLDTFVPIRTQKTRREMWSQADAIARHWRLLTRIHSEDFIAMLRHCHEQRYRDAIRGLFDATPAELGQAALRGAQAQQDKDRTEENVENCYTLIGHCMRFELVPSPHSVVVIARTPMGQECGIGEGETLSDALRMLRRMVAASMYALAEAGEDPRTLLAVGSGSHPDAAFPPEELLPIMLRYRSTRRFNR